MNTQRFLFSLFKFQNGISAVSLRTAHDCYMNVLISRLLHDIHILRFPVFSCFASHRIWVTESFIHLFIHSFVGGTRPEGLTWNGEKMIHSWCFLEQGTEPWSAHILLIKEQNWKNWFSVTVEKKKTSKQNFMSLVNIELIFVPSLEIYHRNFEISFEGTHILLSFYWRKFLLSACRQTKNRTAFKFRLRVTQFGVLNGTITVLTINICFKLNIKTHQSWGLFLGSFHCFK